MQPGHALRREFEYIRHGCAGYVRHVTHDEIADAIG
jgi:hypothetical protein